MRQQVLVVLGILLILGCADEPQGKQYQSGCSEGSNSIPENEFVSPEEPPPEEEPEVGTIEEELIVVEEERPLISQGSNLSGANLSGIRLWNADLTGVNLSGANLTNADLRGTEFCNEKILKVSDLWDPSLREILPEAEWVALFESSLYLACAIEADLTNANLTNANLSDVSLFGANLTNANLTGATFCRTEMPDGSFRNDDC